MTESTHSIAKKGEKFTAAQMITALQATKGMVSIAAKRLGCDPHTVYRYIREYPTVAAAVKAEREATTDMAELALFKAIQEGEAWAVCFYLKTQAKDRGYVERQQVLNVTVAADELAKMADSDLDQLIAQLSK